MYAVVETGGKQYRVTVGDRMLVEKLDNVQEGDQIVLPRVLMVADEKSVRVGDPTLDVVVKATVLDRLVGGKKLSVVRFRKRKNSRTRIGHRQKYTCMQIASIDGFTSASAGSDAIDSSQEQTQATKTQTKTAKTQAKTTKTQAKTTKTQAKTAKTQTKTAKTQAKTAKTQTKTTKTQTKTAKTQTKTAKTQTKTAKTQTTQASTTVKDKPEEIKKSPLLRIDGIGKVIVGRLEKLGITSLQQIAQWQDEDVVKIGEALRFKGRIEREKWVEQAKTLLHTDNT